jgi:hypothetical protein
MTSAPACLQRPGFGRGLVRSERFESLSDLIRRQPPSSRFLNFGLQHAEQFTKPQFTKPQFTKPQFTKPQFTERDR